jgi:anti-sigma factor RsiW
MTDVDRWINLQGPEPRGVRELLDAVRDVPEPTAEEDAALTRSIYQAIAARRRRDRTVRWAAVAAAAAVFAVGLGGVAAVALREDAPDTMRSVDVAREPARAAAAGPTTSAAAAAPDGGARKSGGPRSPRTAPAPR